MLKKKGIKKGAKKIDKLITTFIVGGAIASIFGASRTKKGKKITHKITSVFNSIYKKGFNLSGKTVVHIVNFFSKGKK